MKNNYKYDCKYVFDGINYRLPFGISYHSELGQPQTIKEVFINALMQKQTIWGTGYGQDKHEPYFITEIELSSVTYYEEGFTSSLGSTGPCFTYVWGGPGPDYNVYSLADYGKTWAFTKEELITEENKKAILESEDLNKYHEELEKIAPNFVFQIVSDLEFFKQCPIEYQKNNRNYLLKNINSRLTLINFDAKHVYAYKPQKEEE